MDHLPARATCCEPDPWTADRSVMPLLCTAAALLAETVTAVLGTLSWRTRVSAVQMLLAEPPGSTAGQHGCGRTLNRPANRTGHPLHYACSGLMAPGCFISLLADKKDSCRGR